MTVIRGFEASRFSEDMISEAYERLLPTNYILASGLSDRTCAEGIPSADIAKSISI